MNEANYRGKNVKFISQLGAFEEPCQSWPELDDLKAKIIVVNNWMLKGNFDDIFQFLRLHDAQDEGYIKDFDEILEDWQGSFTIMPYNSPRVEVLKAMNLLASMLNDEDVTDEWLTYGIPDGTDDDAMINYVDDESYHDFVATFLNVLSRAKRSVVLNTND